MNMAVSKAGSIRRFRWSVTLGLTLTATLVVWANINMFSSVVSQATLGTALRARTAEAAPKRQVVLDNTQLVLDSCTALVTACADTGCTLVTGAAGFIGFHVTRALVHSGRPVIAIDSINDYYDPQLKVDRLACLGVDVSQSGHGVSSHASSVHADRLCFIHGDMGQEGLMPAIFGAFSIKKVVHLAAQAGVRYSITEPWKYVQSNMVGFFAVLDAARLAKVQSFVYASSSSVYGRTSQVPYRETEPVNEPVSLYAATKKADEALAYSYASMHGMPTTGLRLFTVYGPWGRPDMALFKFAEAMRAGDAIPVYRKVFTRDFTYVADIVAGILCVLDNPPEAGSTSGGAPYRVFNIAAGRPTALTDMIKTLEDAMGVKAVVKEEPALSVDVEQTWGDSAALQAACPAWAPGTALEQGVQNFVHWHRLYRGGSQERSESCEL